MAKPAVIVSYNLSKMIKALPKETANLLNDIGVVIIKDIREGVERGKDIDGTATKPLKKKTIDRKRKLNYRWPDIARVATNQMVGIRESGFAKGPYFQDRAVPNRLKAIIIPPKIRAPYLIYQQEKRPWFGVSKRLNVPVKRLIDRAAERVVEAVHA